MTATRVAPLAERLIGRIPVRNLWLLMLYASELLKVAGDFKASVEADIDDLPDLVARLLTDSVERRLRRNLTRGYRRREAAITRVRGRIDVLRTETRQLLSRGEVFCRFEELTNDTPRNRLVRSALDLIPRLVNHPDILLRCRGLSQSLTRAGVGAGRPSRADLARDQIGRNDWDDRFMIALAKLVFDLALPAEEAGMTPMAAPDRAEVWVRRLFEKAVLGFARIELEPNGWRVRGGTWLQWQSSYASPGLSTLLPPMQTDIILDPPDRGRRVVIDTKFSSIVRSNRFGEDRLKSGYIYQMYAYLRSQEGLDQRWINAAGLLLHPAIDGMINERVVIQNHPITFATIDLSGSAASIRSDLRTILGSAGLQ